MPFSLDSIVPWGRSYREYRRMFALNERDLNGSILGCGDGPAGFNAEATARGYKVVSVDPLYSYSRSEIRQRIDATFDVVMAQTRRNQASFVWTAFRSLEALGRARMAAMESFLNDYDAGRLAGRYRPAELPALPFENRSFDLAVCSHFLFLYTEQLSETFHIDSVLELCRVAREVRLFPLLALDGAPSRYLAPVIAAVQRAGLRVDVEAVAYEFQRGGNQMLHVASE